MPNDNSCLFYALAYLCEGASASPAVEQRLRATCAAAVLADPDPDTRALFLGKSVAEYTEWIKNRFHWGGESEIIVLAEKYGVEIAVVSCKMMRVLVYGQGPSATHRIYLLYTAQHYDPLVGADSVDTRVADETKRFPIGGSPKAEAAMLEVARAHNEAAEG